MAVDKIPSAGIESGGVGQTNLATGAVAQTNIATGVAGTGPAFSAYQSSAHSFSAGVWTKVQLQTEEFDTNNNFDATTNYRFTPTVAGYYQVNGRITANAIPSVLVVTVYKNGSQWKRGNANANSSGEAVCGSSLVYLNGTTDYIELYGYFSVTTNSFAGLDQTYFQASLARAA